jgi:hypothetical protein
MNNHRIIITMFGLLAAGVLAVVWWIGFPVFQSQQDKSVASSAETSAALRPSGSVNLSVKPTGFKMSDLEFNRLKVNLPAPVNKAWSGAFFDSTNCFESDKKETALNVFPGWIRKALQVGEVELAASYLWSLKKLAEDTDPEISSDAVLAIYLLGDFSEYARTKIRSWITDGWSYKTQDAIFGQTESIDIRARVLRELDLSDDKSFDSFIYDAWLKTKANEAKDLDSVDYAYYLEKNGRKLPSDYWLQRLDNPHGFTNAIEIAQKNKTPQLTEKIKTIFEELRTKPSASVDAGRSALAAAASFRLTGEGRYKDYLIEQTREQLGSGSFENSLSQLLEGLAGTNDEAALAIVSEAMSHKNAVIREMAIDALGKTRDLKAAELLFEAAMQKAKSGAGFPAREMRALLAHNEPNADSKYVQLQQALLSGQLAWAATTSDFEVLEFIRNHGRD